MQRRIINNPEKIEKVRINHPKKQFNALTDSIEFLQTALTSKYEKGMMLNITCFGSSLAFKLKIEIENKEQKSKEKIMKLMEKS